MTKKVWIIAGILLLIIALLTVSIFFYRRSNSLRLLLEECKLDASEDVVQIIDEGYVDGKESIVLMTKALPGYKLGEEYTYGVFLHCVKNSFGFWTLESYASTNSMSYSQFLWNYPLNDGQNEYHAVYCGIGSPEAISWDQFSALLPEQVSCNITQDGSTYMIHLTYTANQSISLNMQNLLRENGVIGKTSIHVFMPDNTFNPASLRASQPIPQSVLVFAVSTLVLAFLVFCCTTLNTKFVFWSQTAARIFDDPVFSSIASRFRIRP